MIVAGQKLTNCTGNAHDAKNERVDPPAAPIEAMAQAESDSQGGRRYIESELNGCDDVTGTHFVVTD